MSDSSIPPSLPPSPTAPTPPTPVSAPTTGKIQPVHIDGALYVAIGVLTAALACLSGDDAVKYAAPATLWWLKMVVGSINAGLLALKMYRSTSYADSKA